MATRIKGKPGVQGPAGPAGPTGPTGPAGSPAPDPVYLTGLLTNGTGNNTSAINTQLAALAAAQGANTGGAVAVLPRGVINIDNVLVPNHVTLVGQGVGTVLRAVSGATGAMLSLAANHNRFVGFESFRVDGNSQNVTGISIDTQDVAMDEYADGMPSVCNVFIHNTGVDGLFVTGRGEGIYDRIRIRDAGRYGINCEGVDNDFTKIMIGGTGSAGVRVAAANNRWSNVKSFYSGVTNFADGHGFFLDGGGGHSNTFTNCEAQDNAAHGFYVRAFDRAMFFGCLADSNNAGYNGSPDQNGCGFTVDGSSYVYIQGASRSRGVNIREQKYGLRMVNGADNLTANLKSDGNSVGHVHNGWHAGVDLAINAYGGQRDQAYVSSFTPNPVTGNFINLSPLTGPMTVNFPSYNNVWTGQRLTIAFTQDATGSRVVTWDPLYKVTQNITATANSTTVMSFIYNGTDYIQVR